MPDSTKTCAVSGSSFVVTEQDQAFYKRVSVDPPSLAPHERERRRMAYRNERSFYNRTCDLCKKQIVSVYTEDAPHPVYCSDCFWGDRWNAFDYGRPFDPDKPFFTQWKELHDTVPQMAMVNALGENTDYSNWCYRAKNCYLAIASDDCEDCYYGNYMFNSNDCCDCLYIQDCQWCYESINVKNCYECFYSRSLEDCDNCWFSFDLKGCSHCFGCVGLRHASYCIENTQYSKEEYEERINSIILTSKTVEEWLEKRRNLRLSKPHKYADIIKCEECTGDNITNSKHSFGCFDSYGLEDSKYITNGPGNVKDCYDLTGTKEAELCLEGTAVGGPGSMNRFCYMAYDGCHDVLYATNNAAMKSSFGCVCTRHAEYCILNKAYSKEEYKKLKTHIIEHMRKTPYPDGDGSATEWGEFFPVSLSPFGYNETIAQEYYPLTQDEALHLGYRWKRDDPHEFQTQTVDFPETITETPDSIVNESFSCETTGRSFRIIPQELEFYRRYGLPVPRKHPDERHADRMRQRNGHTLYDRTCDKCNSAIISPFAPDRPETIYCERCYQNTIN